MPSVDFIRFSTRELVPHQGDLENFFVHDGIIPDARAEVSTILADNQPVEFTILRFPKGYIKL